MWPSLVCLLSGCWGWRSSGCQAGAGLHQVFFGFFCSYAEQWRLTSQELQEPRCLLSPWNRWDHEMKRGPGRSAGSMAAQDRSPLLTGCLASNYTASELRTKLAATFSIKGAREIASFSRTPRRGRRQRKKGVWPPHCRHKFQTPPRTLLVSAAQVAPRLSQEHRVIPCGEGGLRVGR